VIPPTHALKYLPLPQPFVHLPAPLWSLALPLAPPLAYQTLSGINTPHIPCPVILHPSAFEDGTDKVFLNVGYQNSDAGELPKRKHIT